MGFEIQELRRAPVGAMYVSPARICVTADGELCDEDDVRAVRLLVAAGGEIPAAEAAQYGLIAEPEAEPAVDAQAETAATPASKKGRRAEGNGEGSPAE